MFRFRRKALKALIAVGLVGGLVVGCNEVSNSVVDSFAANDKNSVVLSQKNSELVNAMKQGEQNLQMAALSKAVAATLADNSTAQAFHKQAMRKFDGGTEVLWNALNTDQTMTAALGANTWSAAVARNAGKFSLQAGEINSLLEQYSKHYGKNTHLYWCEAAKWDGKAEPLVTFVPVLAQGQDVDKMPGEVVAYDANGKEYIVNEAIAKTRPVIVIAPNERTEMNGQLKASVAENLRPRASLKDGAPLQSSTLSIYALSFASAFEGTWFVEHWILGDPEFYAVITSVRAIGGEPEEWGRPNYAGAITRSMCIGAFFYPNRTTPWNTNEYKTLYWRWFEEDGVAEVEMGVSATFKLNDNISITPSFKVKYKTGDNVLDFMTVNYDDVGSPIRTYTLGANPGMLLAW